MKPLFHLATLACLTFMLTGCATSNDLLSVGGKAVPGDRQRLGYAVSTQTCLVMMSDFKWWPELSGYYLPAGVYKAEREDASGVFFKAPDGFKWLSLTASMDTQGGIYLPKSDTVGVHGHVYLWVLGWGGGWISYLLPDQFFSRYNVTWKIIPANEHPESALEPKATAP